MSDDTDDTDDTYKVINRSALVLEPTPEFLAWVKAMSDDPFEMTFDDFQEMSFIYLLPDKLEDVETWICQNYKPLLEQELFEWCTDDSLWPEDLSFETFLTFFKPHFNPVVVDLGEGPIEAEP